MYEIFKRKLVGIDCFSFMTYTFQRVPLVVTQATMMPVSTPLLLHLKGAHPPPRTSTVGLHVSYSNESQEILVRFVWSLLLQGWMY